MKKHIDDTQLDEMLRNIYSSDGSRIFEFRNAETSGSMEAEVIRVKNIKHIKKIRILTVAVIAAMLAGVFAAVASGLFRKNNRNSEVVQKKIENYFINDSSYNMEPELNNAIENLTVGKDRVYFTSHVSDSQPERKLSVYDKSDNKTIDIDTSGIDLWVFQQIYMAEDYSFICYYDSEEKSCICRVDNASYQVDSGSVKYIDGNVYRISESSRSSLLLTETSENGSSGKSIIKICEYDKGSLSLITSVTLNDMMPDGIYSDLLDGFECEDGYYLICRKEKGQTDMIKKNKDNTTVYTAENICGDMEGEYAGAGIAKNGDPVVFTAVYDGTVHHYFNELDPETGNVLFRYDDDLIEKNVFTNYINFTGHSSDNGSDFEYLDNSAGKVCGYNFETEEKDLICDIKDIKNPQCSFDAAACRGDRILCGYSDNSDSADGMVLFITDMSGKVIRKIMINQDKPNENTDFPVKTYIDKNGDLYVLKSVHNDNSMEVRKLIIDNIIDHYDRDGNLLDTVKLEYPVSDENGEQVRLNRSYNDFIIREDGTIICADDMFISFFSNNGSFIDETTLSECTSVLVSGISEDYIISTGSDLYNTKNIIYRVEHGSTKPENISDFEYSLDPYYDNQMLFDGDEEYDFYLSESDGIYGYKISENKMDEIINWVDSDMELAPQTVALISKDNILCGTNDLEMQIVKKDSGAFNISMLNRASDEILKKIQNSKTLTIACDQMTEPVMKKISEFNRSQYDYRITVREYNRFKTDDPAQLSQFNKDIIKGIMPDIVISNGTIDMNRFSELEMFTDLDELIDNDPDICRDDYYDNVFKAFSSDGKQYQLPVFFRINEIIGKQSVLGEDRTVSFDELGKVSQNNSLFSEDTDVIVSALIKNNISEFVSFEDFTCDFDNEDFICLLEMIKKCSCEEVENTYSDDVSVGLSSSQCMMQFYQLPGMMFQNLMGQLMEPWTYINYPSRNNEGTLVSSDFIAAIAEKSANKEEAWSFVKLLLSDDIQSTVNNNFSMSDVPFPVKRSASEIFIQGNFDIKDNESDSERISRLIASASRSVVNDTNINSVIDEQTGLYLNDSQTAEETAKNIQKKVSLYLKEIK